MRRRAVGTVGLLMVCLVRADGPAPGPNTLLRWRATPGYLGFEEQSPPVRAQVFRLPSPGDRGLTLALDARPGRDGVLWGEGDFVYRPGTDNPRRSEPILGARVHGVYDLDGDGEAAEVLVSSAAVGGGIWVLDADTLRTRWRSPSRAPFLGPAFDEVAVVDADSDGVEDVVWLAPGVGGVLHVWRLDLRTALLGAPPIGLSLGVEDTSHTPLFVGRFGPGGKPGAVVLDSEGRLTLIGFAPALGTICDPSARLCFSPSRATILPSYEPLVPRVSDPNWRTGTPTNAAWTAVVQASDATHDELRIAGSSRGNMGQWAWVRFDYPDVQVVQGTNYNSGVHLHLPEVHTLPGAIAPFVLASNGPAGSSWITDCFVDNDAYFVVFGPDGAPIARLLDREVVATLHHPTQGTRVLVRDQQTPELYTLSCPDPVPDFTTCEELPCTLDLHTSFGPSVDLEAPMWGDRRSLGLGEGGVDFGQDVAGRAGVFGERVAIEARDGDLWLWLRAPEGLLAWPVFDTAAALPVALPPGVASGLLANGRGEYRRWELSSEEVGLFPTTDLVRRTRFVPPEPVWSGPWAEALVGWAETGGFLVVDDVVFSGISRDAPPQAYGLGERVRVVGDLLSDLPGDEIVTAYEDGRSLTLWGNLDELVTTWSTGEGGGGRLLHRGGLALGAPDSLGGARPLAVIVGPEDSVSGYTHFVRLLATTNGGFETQQVGARPPGPLGRPTQVSLFDFTAPNSGGDALWGGRDGVPDYMAWGEDVLLDVREPVVREAALPVGGRAEDALWWHQERLSLANLSRSPDGEASLWRFGLTGALDAVTVGYPTLRDDPLALLPRTEHTFVVALANGRIVAYQADSLGSAGEDQLLRGGHTGSPSASRPAVEITAVHAVDEDADGEFEVLVGTADGWLASLSQLGEPPRWRIPLGAPVRALRVVTLADGGDGALLALTGDGLAHVLVPGSPGMAFAARSTHPCAAEAEAVIQQVGRHAASYHVTLDGTSVADGGAAVWPLRVALDAPGEYLLRVEGTRTDGHVEFAELVLHRGADADGDGWGACPGQPAWHDCDDANGATYPGAVERCDGRDNSCDGRVDEGDVCGGGEDSDVDTGDPGETGDVSDTDDSSDTGADSDSVDDVSDTGDTPDTGADNDSVDDSADTEDGSDTGAESDSVDDHSDTEDGSDTGADSDSVDEPDASAPPTDTGIPRGWPDGARLAGGAGCGCATPAAGGGAAGLALLAVLAIVRRRAS